jgi:hypothetical protein
LGLMMDALVIRVGSDPPTWIIEEWVANGKHLGKIVMGRRNRFSIVAEAAPLIGVKSGPHPNLETAMSAVAQQIKGTCRLWSP